MIGFNLRQSLREPRGRATSTIASLSPSPAWTGVAGSGFIVTPTDPTRTTAKPAMRLIEPPFQVFTDSLTIGVAAYANNNGSLLDNAGLEKVIAHYEGSSVDITAPSVRTFTDANGNTVSYFGWWVTLQRPEGHSASFDTASVYFEAVPKDATMQRRVIGPFAYHPSAVQHDFTMEVAATPAEIPDQRYKTLDAAIARLRQLGAINPLITVSEAGLYELNDDPTKPWQQKAFFTVEASVPGVSLGKPAYIDDSTNAQRTPRIQMCFRGANFTIDFRHLTQFIPGFFVWANGCNITMSGPDGRFSKRRLQQQLLFTWAFASSNTWLTECNVTDMNWIGSSVQLARGCQLSNVGTDAFNGARCVIGNTVATLTNDYWNTDRPIFSVTYTGSEATATFARSGAQGGGNYTAKWGANSATLTTGNAEADFLGTSGKAYAPSDVVDWVNTTLAASDPGWSATLIDDDWLATNGTLPGTQGTGFGDTNVKNAALTVNVMYDTHGDFWQQNDSVLSENVIVADNLGYDMQVQCLFVSPISNAPIRDMVFVNNALHTSEALFPYWDPDVALSQFGRNNTAGSHMVVAHNTFANQGIRLRDSSIGATWDGYCLVANNVSRTMAWDSAPDLDMVIADNHLHAGSTAPSNATGTSIGGDETTLFADRLTGDMTPAGDLLTNKAGPVIRYDIAGVLRKGSEPKGALA